MTSRGLCISLMHKLHSSNDRHLLCTSDTMSLAENLPESLTFQDQWVLEVTQGLPVVRVEIQPGCKPGDNFVSKVSRLILHCLHPSNGEYSASVIVKEIYPADFPQNVIMNCRSMFENEVRAYQKVLPTLQQTLSASSILPKCYQATSNRLVLEDLKRLGFEMANRCRGLRKDECKLALEAVAKLHSQSFILKTMEPKRWEECTNLVPETVFNARNNGEIFSVFWENSLWIALESLRNSKVPELIDAVEALRPFSGHVLQTLRDLSGTRDVFSVICHGDLWSNNLVFRYNNNREPIEIKLLDFQAMRNSSCVLDVMHLLFTSCQPGLLAAHFASLLKHYTKCLTDNTSLPFTLEEVHEELKRKVVYGLLLGFMMIPCAMSDPSSENSQDLDLAILTSEQNLRKQYDLIDDKCHKRIRQLVLDVYSLGLFNKKLK